MQKITIDQYLENRVEDQLKYYSKAAAKAKKRFQRLKVAEVVFASLIPFLSALISADNAYIMKVIVGGIGVGITFLSGVVLLYKFQEDWVNYRATAEALTAEKFKYLSRTGPYKGPQATADFIEKIEKILGDESQKWQTYAMENKQDQLIAEQKAMVAGLASVVNSVDSVVENVTANETASAETATEPVTENEPTADGDLNPMEAAALEHAANQEEEEAPMSEEDAKVLAALQAQADAAEGK